MLQPYLLLFLAIAAETVGTMGLQASQQFTRLGPSLLAIGSYAVAFFFLGLTLKYMPVGIVYAIWSGVGIVLIAALGYVVFAQKLDLPALLGIGLIVAGILVINLFSETAHH